VVNHCDTSSLDVSSDERNILYSQLDAGGSDVMLARTGAAAISLSKLEDSATRPLFFPYDFLAQS
jgi:hypothetical protein